MPKSAGFKVSAYRQTGTSERWGLRVYFRPAPGKKAVRVLSTSSDYLDGHTWSSREEAERLRNVRSFRYWVDYVMGRRNPVVPPTDRLPASRGRGERKSLGRRQGRRVTTHAHPHDGGLSSRLDGADAADAAKLAPIIDLLDHCVTHDLEPLLAESLESFSQYELLHLTLRATAVLQYLMAQVHDRRPNETLHDLADRVASRWGSRFTGRTLRGWLASFLDNDLKFPLNGRGKWARELLILEEDMLLKFKRWLIGRVKKEDLSVDTAHAFINEQLLKPLTETEEGREMLREYKISYPIARSTAHRWMLAAGCKYVAHKQSYYQDKHQCPIVLEFRSLYLKV